MRGRSPIPALAVAALALGSAGCVERRLSIETVPEGAEVIVDGRSVGRSPVTVPFDFYGAREIVCRLPGHETVRSIERLEPPFFQRFPWDLYYEVLTRERYVDHRSFRYVLRPMTEEELSREVVDRRMREAKEMRLR